MKKIILFSLLATTSILTSISAQSPARALWVNGLLLDKHNALAGTALDLRADGEAKLQRRVSFQGSALVNIPVSSPLVGGISFMGEALIPLEGLGSFSLNVQPWTVVGELEDGSRAVMYGGASLHLNPQTNIESSPKAIKVVAGVEGIFPVWRGKLPFSMFFVSFWERGNIEKEQLLESYGLELGMTFPVSPGMGLYMRSHLPFGKVGYDRIHFGVVINNPLGG